MKAQKLFLLSLFFGVLTLSCSTGSSPKESTTATSSTPADGKGAAERERIAADIVSNLSKSDYDAVRKDFAKIMLDGLPVSKVKESYEGLTAKIGAFQRVVATQESQVHGYNQVKKRCQFASENASVLVTFNEENKVIGLFLTL